jgi:hypothetical protein
MNRLEIHRFNGTEFFHIESAKFFTVCCGDELMLWFEIETSNIDFKTCSDTLKYPARPKAELGIRVQDFNTQDFVGREFHHDGTKDDDDDSCNSLFYYYNHQPMRNNHLTVLSNSSPEIFRIRWTASTQDVNYYDGSKTDAMIKIECDFMLKVPRD